MLQLGLVDLVRQFAVYLVNYQLKLAFFCELVLVPEEVLLLVGCGHFGVNKSDHTVLVLCILNVDWSG